MKKYIIALLLLLLVSVPVQTVSAAETVSSGDYSESVDGETEEVYDPLLVQFVDFMKVIFDFVATEFTIWGFTFSYWQVIILSCVAGMVGWFICEVFS